MEASPSKTIVCPRLIGRETLLASLNRSLREAAAGNGQTVLLTGEAGIGKSRLVREVKAEGVRCSFRTVEAHCFEPDRSLPYAPLLDLHRSLLAGGDMGQIMQELGPNAQALTPLLPELARLLPELPPTVRLDPEQERRRLVHAIAQLFRNLSARQPMLGVLTSEPAGP